MRYLFLLFASCCFAADLPNSKLTPGVALKVTKEQVCVPGYATSVRNVSAATKKQVYTRYHVKDVPGAYEVDHLIALTLGGSNDIQNLWPEKFEPRPGAHEKDLAEGFLHQAVCSGEISLHEAQREIRTNWYAVYLRLQTSGRRK